jgi:hypothetical protein
MHANLIIWRDVSLGIITAKRMAGTHVYLNGRDEEEKKVIVAWSCNFILELVGCSSAELTEAWGCRYVQPLKMDPETP